MRLWVLLGLLLATLATPASADEVRPLYVESRAEADGTHLVKWQMPPNFAAQAMPVIALPADCTARGAPRSWAGDLGNWREQRWQCRSPLAGKSLRVNYPHGNPNLATIFKAVDTSGASTIAVFLPNRRDLPVPASGNSASYGVFVDYLLLGIEHIWIGIDHLLFVSCLIWIAGTPRRVLQTITGFTAAHSLTLVLSALNLAAVPVKTTEVLIALSIVLLAVELARGRRATLTWRRPVAVSAGFGLLHGFGFAAALREVGLPEDGFVKALLAFNVGIEIGQLIFAAALIAATMLVVRLLQAVRAAGPASEASLVALPPQMRLLIAYSVGITATCWMLQRAA